MSGAHAPLALALALLPLAGCLELVGGSDGRECDTNEHCPLRLVCDPAAGRCVEGERPELDWEPLPDEDARIRDAMVSADAGGDGSGDASDLGVDAVVDAAPDLGPDVAPPPEGPYGEPEDCFAMVASDTLAEMPPGSTHVPRAFCTSHLLAWTAEVDGAVRLLFHAGGDHTETPDEGPEVVPDTRIAADRDVVLMTSINPRHEKPNIQRVDLRTGDAEFLQPRNASQSQPARTHGLSAFVEQGDTTRQVRLHFDDPLEGDLPCIRGGKHQWGVALGPDWVAFFERSAASRRTDLVVTRGHRCDDGARVTLPLPGTVDDEERLVVAGDRLLWVAGDPQTRERAVWSVSRHALAAGAQPLALPVEGPLRPVDIAARGDWLAVVSYRPGGYRLDVFDLDSGEQKFLPNSAGNALWPSFSNSYLLWAEQSAAQPWEVRFARLEDL